MCIFLEYLDILKTQFLSCFNVQLIDWKNLKNITWEQQEKILENVLECNLNLNFPVKSSYQLMFLKTFIEYLEVNRIEIHDRIYEIFCNLKTKSVENENFVYKHYLISDYKIYISLQETKSFVSEGTTGLCSWQASLALSNWILNNQQVVNNKSVLELGAGTGLCSFTTLKCCRPKEIMITDGSVKVLDLLHINLINNFENLKLNESINNICNKYESSNENISTMLFPWEEVEDLNIENYILPDVILAADVVYDNSIFMQLFNAINYVFNYMKNKCVMYLAATVRNLETLNSFLQILVKNSYSVKQIGDELEEKYFYWDNTTSINIYCIRK